MKRSNDYRSDRTSTKVFLFLKNVEFLHLTFCVSLFFHSISAQEECPTTGVSIRALIHWSGMFSCVFLSYQGAERQSSERAQGNRGDFRKDVTKQEPQISPERLQTV